jgi:two-component system, LytTR family, sensor kinase
MTFRPILNTIACADADTAPERREPRSGARSSASAPPAWCPPSPASPALHAIRRGRPDDPGISGLSGRLHLPAGAAATRAAAHTWWRAILNFAPLCWLCVFVIEVTNMEAWRIANTELQVAPPSIRAVQFLLLLPALVFACRAAIAVGAAPRPAALRAAGQLLIGVAFSALARPALVTAAWLTQHREIAAGVATSLLSPTREAVAVWIASTAAMALNYAVCLGVVVGVKTYRDLGSERVARANVEREAVQARLQALTNQLNPHFLFNVLNTIVSLIESQPRLAQTLVTRFADLLRRILNDGATQYVSLGRELELLEQYIEIQEMRFPQRLSHDRRIAAGTAEALVPALVMQPIIENAVVHGLRRHDGPVHVCIEAEVAGATLEIRVSNPGWAAPAGHPPPAPGVGLRNVAERLRTLFGERGGVELHTPAPGRYVTIVRMPLLAGTALAGADAT